MSLAPTVKVRVVYAPKIRVYVGSHRRQQTEEQLGERIKRLDTTDSLWMGGDEEYVRLVARIAGCSREEARAALKKHNGLLAEAIDECEMN